MGAVHVAAPVSVAARCGSRLRRRTGEAQQVEDRLYEVLLDRDDRSRSVRAGRVVDDGVADESRQLTVRGDRVANDQEDRALDRQAQARRVAVDRAAEQLGDV